MTKNNCILSNYRKDNCSNCDNFCPHRIALHGFDGNSGRIATTGLPADYRGITLVNSPARDDQADTYRLLERYVATFRRTSGEPIKSLYLWSESPGTGKTTTAAALISEWVAVEYLTALKGGKHIPQSSAYFLDINEMQSEYNIAVMTDDSAAMKRIGDEIKRAQSKPFLVIDDIGVRDATEAFRAYIHAIINSRTTNRLPTVYTSNLPIGEMARVFDGRLYDRIRDQCGVIEFKGGSKRKGFG